MGLTKQYLHYEADEDRPVRGIIGSGTSIKFVTINGSSDQHVAVSAAESVNIWNLDTREKVRTITPGVEGVVTSIECTERGIVLGDDIIIGYSDGTVVMYNISENSITKLKGHVKAVKTLALDKEGMMVASASEAGDIVVWDLLAEKGLVRLKGHTGRVTKMCFMKERNTLITSGADTYIKFWHLNSNHCFHTLTGHSVEIVDFLLLNDETRLVTGCLSGKLRVWEFNFLTPVLTTLTSMKKKDESEKLNQAMKKTKISENSQKESKADDDVEKDNSGELEVRMLGTLNRTKDNRIFQLVSTGPYFSCLGKGKVIDSFLFLNTDEANEKREKRLKKYRKRLRNADDPAEVPGEPESIILNDEIYKLAPFSSEFPPNGIDVIMSKAKKLKVAGINKNNSISLYNISCKGAIQQLNQETWEHVTSINLEGHRSEPRAVSFTSLGDEFVTASADSLMVWAQQSDVSKLTIECEMATCLLIPPGDRHALVGTRLGAIKLYSLASGDLIQDTQAHFENEHKEACVWSIATTSDQRGFVSGGADCALRFWSYEMVEVENNPHTKALGFVKNEREMKASDQITAVSCSPNGLYVTMATLDMKETICFMDTLKVRQELYGKTLPSTCLDFSDDAVLIVTGSKDSCIRIHSCEFGDERKMLKNAHQGGVTDLKFVPKTHHFFSCGVDGKVKRWDADNFQRIQTLHGHHGIVRCLTISPNGNSVISCGQDNSIREWMKTEEPLILDEEREKERRLEEQPTLVRPVLQGERGGEAVRSSIMTMETEKTFDDLLEGIEVYFKAVLAGPDAPMSPLMTMVHQTTDPEIFFHRVLRNIKSNELEEAILLLPYDAVLKLLFACKCILVRNLGLSTPATVAIHALTMFHAQLSSDPKANVIIGDLLPQLKKVTERTEGFSIHVAGLRYHRKLLEDKEEQHVFYQAAENVAKKRSKAKKKSQIQTQATTLNFK